MAKEIMKKRAADNRYLHKDFHLAMNIGVDYVKKLYGSEGVRDYLRQVALAYYRPLKEELMTRGLISLKEHFKRIYAIEECDIDISFTSDELVLKVRECPAVRHIKACGHEVSDMFYETTKTVNEAICEDTPFTAVLVKYDSESGSSEQLFYRRPVK